MITRFSPRNYLIIAIFLLSVGCSGNSQSTELPKPLFFGEEMPLAWRYTKVFTDINGWRSPGDTLEVVFVEKRALSPIQMIQYKEETGLNLLSPLWVVIGMDDRRKRTLWFETTQGVMESPSDDILLSDLLVPREPFVGQQWQWTPGPDNRRLVVAIKDTLVAGTLYRSVIEILSETHQGERYTYGWVENYGLVYYSTNWVQEEMGKVEYSIERIGDVIRRN